MPVKIVDAQVLYDQDKKINESDVSVIRQWLRKQPHLPNISDTDIIYFLHSCYYSIESAKNAIDHFYTMRTEYPNIFGKQDPRTYQIAINESIYFLSPILTPEGYVVMLTNLKNCNPNTYLLENHIKYCGSVLYLSLIQIGLVNGVVFIMDMDGVSWEHVTRIPISVLKAFITYIQEGLPIRFQSIHFINTVSFMDKVMTLMKPFIKSELVKKMHFHSRNFETLYQYVPLECLSSDYGGNAPSMADLHERAKALLSENNNIIEEDDLKRVDESKRPTTTKNEKSLFGTEGSFKKLEID